MPVLAFRLRENDLFPLSVFDRIGVMKRRILLWLCPIVILFLGVGLYAVLLFNRLGGSIDVILRENIDRQPRAENSADEHSHGASSVAGGENRAAQSETARIAGSGTGRLGEVDQFREGMSPFDKTLFRQSVPLQHLQLNLHNADT